MQSLLKRNRVVLMHLSFWCVYLSFFVYQVSSFQREQVDWFRVFKVVTIQFSFAMLLGYLNYFYFLPKIVSLKNGWKYVLYFLIIFTVVMIFRLHLERYVIDGYHGREEYLYRPRFIVHVFVTNFFIVIFLGMIRFAVEWFEFEARKRSIENENLTAELNFLKAQINPHFLFNTLNNLYYLAYTKSPNTPEIIAKLSNMMRYMIYDSNYPDVPLMKEIEYMQNYISLERLRLNDQIPISFDIEGDPGSYRITPLIFITFLENAFKHGVSNSNPKSWVRLKLQLKGKSCIYQVENSKAGAVKPDAGEKSGIGLQNLKRRLELSYPGKHSLDVVESEENYQVTLKINLA
jgi:two-component system, LytTR family, sensor histidine kinase AlgZ